MMYRLCIVLTIMAALVGSAPGRAQEGSAGERAGHAAPAAGAAHGASAEPDILSPVLDLTIWSLVVFLVLVWVLGRFAWKPMLEGLKRREETIRSALDEAQRAREEAKRVQSQFQAEMDRAAERVRDMMDGARRDAQRMNDEMIAKARAEIQAERERLRREIETARDQALAELWNHTARLATQISAKAIRRELNSDDHRRLVDEALAELGQAVGKRGNGR
jgi:F-type H+-transporting ATPase subunit b